MTDLEKLAEKYYHSMGEVCIGEGNLEEGIIYFQKAIDIGDTPYAWYGLARALGMAEDTAGAVGAISRAIKLAPGIPEYYHERSRFLASLGRPDLAGEDMKKAVDIDDNYKRIDIIRNAAGILNEAFRDVFDKPSCPVRVCPSYCCHFKDSMFLHGVTVKAWKLNAIREYCAENGLREKDFLASLPVEGVDNAGDIFPPCDMMKYNGALSVIFPLRGEEVLDAEFARDIPKSRYYRTLMWIDAAARPCSFLEKGRCSIYAAGGEPSLDSCASFLCMTGFVFTVLGHLGMLDEKWLAGRAIADLNQTAVEALIILGDVYGNEELRVSDPADDTLRNKLLAQARRKIFQLFDESPARP